MQVSANLTKILLTGLTVMETAEYFYNLFTFVTEYRFSIRIWYFFHPLHRMLNIAISNQWLHTTLFIDIRLTITSNWFLNLI